MELDWYLCAGTEEEEEKYVELGKMLIGYLFGFSAERCGIKVWCVAGTPTTV